MSTKEAEPKSAHTGIEAMQLASFDVTGLFGRYHHTFNFPRPSETSASPSIVILHGPNGVGKTTILRMIDGLMRLDFDIFRVVPFSTATLRFSRGPALTVRRGAQKSPLVVSFGKRTVELHPTDKGPSEGDKLDLVQAFRDFFADSVRPISLDYIGTDRGPVQHRSEAEQARAAYDVATTAEQRLAAGHRPDAPHQESNLRQRVRLFIAEAQADYSRFFTTDAPTLFERIFTALQEDVLPASDPSDLRAALRRLEKADTQAVELGLRIERVDYKSLVGYLPKSDASAKSQRNLAVIHAYVDGLEAQAARRQLVAQRLINFRETMNDFLLDKEVVVGGRDGLTVRLLDGPTLTYDRLSSGEFHLLYLMVAALTATRRGTVIAIDEPELSMHIGWQKKLIRNLVRSASNAVPQFIFATHSPDIVAEYRQFMVPLDG